MITQTSISHYKSIGDARVDLRKQNIIVGANGVGKSNLVDALYFVHDCVIEDIDTAVTKRHGIESIRQWSKTRPYNITIEITFKNNNGEGKYSFVLASARGAFTVLTEYGEWTGPNPLHSGSGESTIGTSTFERSENGSVTISHPYTDFGEERTIHIGSGDLFITSLHGPLIRLSSLLFRSMVSELASFSAYSIYPNTLRQPQIVSREETLLQDGSNLATILKRMNSGHKRNKEQLLDALHVVLPMISDILVKSAGGYYVPVLKVKEHYGDQHEFNMSQVSDGTLRVLGLLTAFYQPNAPGKIAVEEPEQMIHPGVLPVIADAASDFGAAGDEFSNQVFITTHSPNLLDLFNPDNILWVNFSGGLTHCGRITSRQLELIKSQLFSPGEVLVSEGFLDA